MCVSFQADKTALWVQILGKNTPIPKQNRFETHSGCEDTRKVMLVWDHLKATLT